MQKCDIRKILLYIIEGNGHTLKETSQKFKVSYNELRVIINDLFDEDSPYYDEALKDIVEDKLTTALKAKMKSPEKKLDKDKALALRFKNVYQNVSYEEIAKDSGMPLDNVLSLVESLDYEDRASQDEMIDKLLKKR